MAETEDGAEALRLRFGGSRDSRKRSPRSCERSWLRSRKPLTRQESATSRSRSAITLGLKPDTLMRWCRGAGVPKKLARVVVQRAAQPALTMHGPAGADTKPLELELTHNRGLG